MKKSKSKFSKIFGSVDFWKIVIPALSAIFVWWLNSSSRIEWERYQKKEENYRELIKAIEGFYEISEYKIERRQKFIEQISLSWLYASDEVIINAYQFLETQKVGKEQQYSQQRRKEAMGKLILSIRQDLLSMKSTDNTKLKKSDFQFLFVTQSTN
ncbi:hypothetical protein [Muricauda sp. MAR_2010_75]|jgi:hypothetical protein|uniref:hypothetical protein n=1 Tax=Allomuricauda sp. MAR_2010_75 TaxID=1250232 RepID=UPI00055AE49D|nr:hypothetical protein [Muricauda sp. MAR_2010_75]